MFKTWNITLNDLRRSSLERDFWVFTFLVPAVMVIIIAAANGGFATPGQVIELIDVIDQDNSAYSAQLLDHMRGANKTIVLCPMDNNDSDICRLTNNSDPTNRLKNETTRAMIEIPAGFEAAVQSGETVTVNYRSKDDPNQPGYAQQTLQAAVQRLTGATIAQQLAQDVQAIGVNDPKFVQNVYVKASEIWAENPISVDYREITLEENPRSRPGFRQSVPGMGTMFVMFTVMGGAVGLLLERKQWTLQRLVSMPLRKSEIIGGKMLARFLLGLLQYAVVFVVGLAFGTSFGNSVPGLVLVMAAFVICISTLTLLLATFAKNEAQASGLVTFLALTLAPLSGAWWPMEIMPDFMQQIAQISPMTWAMRGFNEIIFFGGGVTDVLPSVVVLLTMAVVLFATAVRRFKYE
jgi:ABC-2 type transport system permease protein